MPSKTLSYFPGKLPVRKSLFILLGSRNCSCLFHLAYVPPLSGVGLGSLGEESKRPSLWWTGQSHMEQEKLVAGSPCKKCKIQRKTEATFSSPVVASPPSSFLLAAYWVCVGCVDFSASCWSRSWPCCSQDQLGLSSRR
jgi:hypothetical protein